MKQNNLLFPNYILILLENNPNIYHKPAKSNTLCQLPFFVYLLNPEPEPEISEHIDATSSLNVILNYLLVWVLSLSSFLLRCTQDTEYTVKIYIFKIGTLINHMVIT